MPPDSGYFIILFRDSLVWERGASAQIAPDEVKSSGHGWPWLVVLYLFSEALEDTSYRVLGASGGDGYPQPLVPVWLGRGCAVPADGSAAVPGPSLPQLPVSSLCCW